MNFSYKIPLDLNIFFHPKLHQICSCTQNRPEVQNDECFDWHLISLKSYLYYLIIKVIKLITSDSIEDDLN